MADFLTDYSNLAGAGSAFQGFAQGFQNAQDQKMKRQEMQAKMDAMKADQDRAADEAALKQRMSGVVKTGPGQFSDVPETEKQQEASDLSAQEKGLKTVRDPITHKPTRTWDPQSPQVLGAGMKRDVQTNAMDQKTNNDWEKFSTTINNPSSRATLGRYQQQLDKAGTLNALANQIGMGEGQQPPANETLAQKTARFNKADSRQLYEFAKSADQLISAGGSTVYGTDHLMPKDMQIGGAKIAEWAAGGPMPANAGEFIARYLDSANRENNYFTKKRDAAVAGVAAGFQHLKKKDPDRWEQVLRSTAAQQDAPAQQAPQAAAPSQGLVQPQSKGMLSGLVDRIMPQAAAAAPAQQAKPQTVIQNGHTYTLNPKTGQYE